MRSFFKYFFAALLAFFVAIVLVVVIPIAVVAASGDTDVDVKNNSVLKLDFNRVIPERTDNVERDFMSFDEKKAIGLHRIKDIIEAAGNDNKIKAIVIQNSSTGLGGVATREIMESIKAFKESGKPVYSYSDYLSQRAYYLSSAADSIFINPNGAVDLKGLGTALSFFKGTLDEYGVDMDIFYAGKFKSATEPFRRKEMSAANKEQVRVFLDGMLEVMQDDIAKNRNISAAKLNDIMNNLSGRSARLALKNGLVDGVIFRDQFENKLKKAIDIDSDKDIEYIGLDKYNLAVNIKPKGDRKKKIAVVFAEGSVNYGTNKKGEINEKVYLKALNKIKKDDKIKAVVLRVNSGGGSSLTSDIIWRAVEEVKAAGKPVVASFGSVAASGGYYIACGADKIVAEPNTITGSIGVFTMIPSMKNFFNKNLKVTFDSVKTNKHALAMTGIYPIRGEEAKMVQESVDEIYHQFLSRVAEGRGMTVEAVNEVAQGRVWTGIDAQKNGLVDELGGLEKAIEIAQNLAEVENPRMKYYPSIEKNPIEELLSAFPATQSMIKNNLPEVSATEVQLYKKFKELQMMSNANDPQARLPFSIDVY